MLTVSVGHANPKVNEAIDRAGQDDRSTRRRFTRTSRRATWRKSWRRSRPGNLKKSFFTRQRHRSQRYGDYRGKTRDGQARDRRAAAQLLGRSATALSGSRPFDSGNRFASQVPGIVHARAPYCYRCPFNADAGQLRAGLCRRHRRADPKRRRPARSPRSWPRRFFGVGGFIVPPTGYFERVDEIANKYGGLFICDEVQTGVGPHGRQMVRHRALGRQARHHHVCARAWATAYPIGMTIATPEVADKYPGITFATFGGNPVSMAAGARRYQSDRRRRPAQQLPRGRRLLRRTASQN